MSVVLYYKRRRPVDFRYDPFATEVMGRCNVSRRANPDSSIAANCLLFNHLVRAGEEG